MSLQSVPPESTPASSRPTESTPPRADPDPRAAEWAARAAAELDRTSAWSRATRDRSFMVVFIGSLIGVLVVFSVFADALLLASATAVVTWPLFERIRRRTGNRTYLASAITTVLVILLILMPILFFGVWLIQEAAQFVQLTLQVLNGPELRSELEQWMWTVEIPGEEYLTEILGPQADPLTLILEPLQRNLVTLGQGVASALPDLLGMMLAATLDVLVFVATLVTLYAEGPRLLKGVLHLSPLRPEYQRRLFEVFREFSSNLVVAGLTTALVQALIASIGFGIAGVPNLVLFGFLVMLFSFIPIVGTATVWVPVAIWVGLTHHWGWALFVVLWNAGLTGTVDNVLRPLLLRGRSPIHPLPIFLGVLGGIAWMGLPGALVGPVLVAVFLALYRIWTEELAEQGILLVDATPGPAQRTSLPPRAPTAASYSSPASPASPASSPSNSPGTTSTSPSSSAPVTPSTSSPSDSAAAPSSRSSSAV